MEGIHMQVERPNDQPTPDELKDLDKLRAIIEHAVADGKLSDSEYQTIKRAVWEDHKVSPQELDIVQQLIWDKIQSGELEMTW
jgi:uncharacterized membrane protein YebE (DUF533 family)